MKKIIIFILISISSQITYADNDPFKEDIQAIREDFKALEKFDEIIFSKISFFRKTKPNYKTEQKLLKFVKRKNSFEAGIPFSIQSMFLGPVSVALNKINAKIKHDTMVLIVLGGMAITTGIIYVLYVTSHPDGCVSNASEACIYDASTACAEAVFEAAVYSCAESCNDLSFFMKVMI